jgi:Xaa-Pro aminopeptidase
MDYEGRLSRLQAAIGAAGLSGVVYGAGANCQYFTGLPERWTREAEPVEPAMLLVVTPDEVPRLVVPPGECETAMAKAPHAIAVVPGGSRADVVALLRRLLPDGRVGTGRTAAPYLTGLIAEADATLTCVEAEDIGASLRVVKDKAEIAALRRAVALTDRVMEAVRDQIRLGVSQHQLQEFIRAEGLRLGAQDVSFPPAALYVKSGTAPGPEPFGYPKDQGLVGATSIAFDFGFVLDGHCSDFGRSFYMGPAPDHFSAAYRALHASQLELIRQMRPGLALGEFWGILSGEMDRHGYGDRIRARLKDGTLGHQIGVDLHENPWIRPGVEFKLLPGMVMAIEPKAWLPGEYYLRVEDIVLVTEDGAECLTAADRLAFELPL